MAMFLVQALGSIGALSYLNVDLSTVLKPKGEDGEASRRDGSSSGSRFLPSFINGRDWEGGPASRRAWTMVSGLSSVAYLGSVAYSLYKLSKLVSREHSYKSSGLLPTTRARQRVQEWKWAPNAMRLGRFVNKDGLLLALHVFPASPRFVSKGVILLVHGVGQHALLYSATAQQLSERGYNVYALDLQGHGASEGDRFYFKKFEDLTADVLGVLDLIRAQHKDADIFILGASSGALIALDAASKVHDTLKGLILVGPTFKSVTISKVDPYSQWKETFERLMSDYLPKIGHPSVLAIDNHALLETDQSRDILMNDPLLDGKLTVRAVWELKRACAAGMRRLLADPLPAFFVLQGDQDTLSDIVKPGEHKRSIPNGRHLLLLDEKTQSDCMELISKWMDSRLSAQVVAAQWANSMTSALKQTISQKLTGGS